jgi:V8-like Glu-specific endopeptidase
MQKMNEWELLRYIAGHYGSRKDKFLRDYHNLEQMRQTGGSPMDLEENKERVKKRVAREGGYQVAVERIMGVNDQQEVYILNTLYQLSKSVCRITYRGHGIGTGFLVAENIIITNHHVMPNEREGNEMAAEFDFQLNPPPDRSLRQSTSFACDPATFFLSSTLEENPAVPFSGLDFTLVALKTTGSNQRRIQEFNPVLLDGNIGKIIKGESCVIIQHPEGRPKKVALKNAAFFSETHTRIIYETDTLPGSSGSMVVALGTGEIIALHHAGLPATDEKGNILTKYDTIAGPGTPEQDIKWIGNQGIKISEIVKAIRGANLPTIMEKGRQSLLRNTEQIAGQLKKAEDTMNTGQEKEPVLTGQTSRLIVRSNKPPEDIQPKNPVEAQAAADVQPAVTPSAAFIFTAMYNDVNMATLSSLIQSRFGTGAQIRLSMPASARYGQEELFNLNLPSCADPRKALQQLLLLPGVINAEWDYSLHLNTAPAPQASGAPVTTESFLVDDGFGEPNEKEFLDKYDGKSKYVKKPKNEEDEEQALANRQWNWVATGFDKALKEGLKIPPGQKGIRIVQFDTGYSDHTKVLGGFNTEYDADFVGDDNTPDDARDSNSRGFLKMPGHGTRTGSILIGRNNLPLPGDGNPGLLAADTGFQITPYRIAKSVILINRQQELAAALDRAIQQGFDIITMSMGLPPTIATARMAKKAYDAGIIWCSAAGNEVKFVVAPAVYPGTIAVAASNPLDALWKGSSRGSTVDITAPGEDVYVPIMYKDKEEGKKAKEGFAYGNGTSYATPHVAAAAALWLAAYKTELNSHAYRGWRRIEAFRIVLRNTARKKHNIKEKGHGAGILDVTKLLQTPPTPPSEKDYAYNAWNEKAFFANLQGLAEIGKTYWNGLHGWLFGRKKSIYESVADAGLALSDEDRMLEAALFGSRLSATESAGLPGQDELLERLNILNQKLFDNEG